MRLARGVHGMAGKGADGVLMRRMRLRRGWRLLRRCVAVVLGPVTAAGTSLVPVTAVAAAVTAGVAAAAVASAPAAQASTVSGDVLVVLVNGESSAPEASLLSSAGYTVTTATPATLAGMSQATFEGYAAVVVGDSSSGGSCDTTAPLRSSLGSQWQAWVSGNVALLGTAPELAAEEAASGEKGADALITDSVEYAAAGYSASAKTGTGLYVSLACGYSTAAAGTALPLLTGLPGIADGAFTVNGAMACTDAGTVNTWEADEAGTFSGFTSSDLAAGSSGSWPSPGCPVQEAFDSWPASFTPVAYDPSSNTDVTANFTASDAATGQPYVLLGQPAASAPTLALTPATGGEVPVGTTAGGSGNPAAPGVAHAVTSGSVDTGNGDFTQDDTDVSIPGFGTSLEFDRTYDAQAAQAQEQTGTPGAMGYGWTDNWASSLTASSPIPGDIYALDGLAGASGSGEGLTAYAANGQAGGSALLGAPGGVVEAGGNVYFSDTSGNRVEEIPQSTGTQWGIAMTAGDTYTIAGSYTGQTGTTDGGLATNGLLAGPTGLALDSAGNLYIADTGNNRVQEVSNSTGDITTLAGNGARGAGADGIAADTSSLADPTSVAVDSAGNVYIADAGNNRIQEVAAAAGTQWDQSMTAGDVYTVAGSPTGASGDSANGTTNGSSLLDDPRGVAVNATAGGIYVADSGNCKVVDFVGTAGTYWGLPMNPGHEWAVAGSSTGSCGAATDKGASTASELDDPDSVIVAGNMYIADTGSNQVQEVAATAHTELGQSMTANDIYDVVGTGTAGNSGNGGLASAGEVNGPQALFVSSAGNMWIADTGSNQVRGVTASTGDISLVAGGGQDLASTGNGGPAVNGELVKPSGEIADSHGDLYVTDANNNRVQEIAAYTHTQWGISMTGGDVYTIAGSATGAGGNSGDKGPATAALLADPQGLAFDAAGDLYIADQGNNQVREIYATGGQSWGNTGWIAGDIYTVAGSVTGASGTTTSHGSTNVAAASGLLYGPYGIAVDAKGDVYIADKDNNRIQEIAAAAGTQWGQSMTADDIYTVAGSYAGTGGDSGDGAAASAAALSGPQGLAVDAAGDLFIADTANEQVRMVPVATGTYYGQKMTANDIYTVAGSTAGTAGSSGDNGPATGSELHTPVGLALDPAGDLYIADGDNDRIQEIAAVSGTAWETQMTANDIYTIAGKAGTASDTGNGGPASMATVYFAVSAGTDSYGDLYIGDLSGGQLREIPSATPATINPAPGLTSALYPAPGSTIGTTTYPAGITITQPGGAQVTFYPKTSSGTCAAPEVPGGGYCVEPAFTGATLTANGTTSYTFTTGPGSGTYTYSWDGQLTAETDAANETLTITYDSPAPGSVVTGDSSQVCPSSANSCQTITSPSGRALVLGMNSSGLVTSVTDPMGRQWAYAYNSALDMTAATDPMGNVTTYAYDSSNANPLLAADLLTITGPNGQPGGPDGGDSSVNVYNSSGQVTQQTDPMGNKTTFNYCASASAQDCLDAATGSGFVTVTDPDGDEVVYDYQQGTMVAQSNWTDTTSGLTLTAEQDNGSDLSEDGTDTAGTLEDTWATDGNNNLTTYAYDANGDSTAVTAPDGIGAQTETTTAWYNGQGNESCSGTAEAATPCSASEPGPSSVAQGGVITPPSSAPPQGVTYTLYDTDGNELYATTGVYEPGATSAAYSQTTYTLYKNNSVTLNGTSISCATQPPSITLPCATINADGVVTQLTYDSAGDLASSSTPDGNGSELAETTYSYDGDGDQTSEVAPDGNVSGASAATTANYTTATAYNADGEQTSVTQAAGSGATVTPRTTSYGYDGDGNKTSVTDARGYATSMTFNADDEETLTTDPDGDQSLACYDGDGNQTETVPPVGVAADNLTPGSCPTSYPAGYGDRLAADATTTTFDALGDKTAVTTPAPAGQTSPAFETTSYSYDGAGNLIKVVAPAASTGGPAQVTVSTYNPANELSSQTAADGTSAASTTSYCYDPDGDETSVVMPDGNTSGTATCETSSPWVVSSSSWPTQAAYQTTSSYDSAGEQVSSTSPATTAAPNGATTTNSYDPAGNMLTSADPDGVTMTWTYTPDGNTASTSYSGSSAHSVTDTYDADGSQTGMTDGTGTSAYVYDPFGELASATNGAGQIVAYSYDADGDNTGITYPLPSTATWASTDTVSYGYDKADNLTSVTDFTGHQIGITNNADGLPISQALGSTGDTVTTGYDNTDSPSAITLKNSSSTLQSFSYSDAPDGSILSETDVPASSSASYTYDGRGRLASMTIGSNPALDYGFDASGNLTTLPTGASATYDHASELTSSSLSGTTTSYAYNADGDQLTATQGSTTVSSGTWNGADEATAWTSPAGTMSAASYDGNGVRASATFTPSGGTAATQEYTWNTNASVPLLLMDSDNAYIYAGGGTPAEQVSLATGTASYLSSDSLGSVRGIISAAGALTATTSYDAWGNPQTAGGLTAYTPFGYAGAYTDPDGLLYLINRYYNPQTGQFTSVDPMVAQTLAPYSYVGGDPVTATDPNGLLHLEGDPGGGNDYTSQAQAQEDAVYDATAAYIPPPPPPPLPRPVHHPRPRPKPVHHHCGLICSAFHWVGHEVHKHWKAIVKTGMAAAAVGLTIANVAQAGLDPVTDGLEAADIGGLAAEDAGEDAGEDAAEDAATCGGESFTGGTKVLLASGAAIPISQLKPGDKVLATNTKTGKTQAEPVAAVLLRHDTDRYDLKIRSGHRTAVIDTTRRHLFFDLTRHRWVQADRLHHGDKLRGPKGRASATVISGHAPRNRDGWMWDLSVPGGSDHDFYIDVATTAVLVHNCPKYTGPMDPDDEDYPDSSEPMKPAGHGPPNYVENPMARDAASEAGLDPDQAESLHRNITGQQLSYQEILDEAWRIAGGDY